MASPAAAAGPTVTAFILKDSTGARQPQTVFRRRVAAETARQLDSAYEDAACCTLASGLRLSKELAEKVQVFNDAAGSIIVPLAVLGDPNGIENLIKLAPGSFTLTDSAGGRHCTLFYTLPEGVDAPLQQQQQQQGPLTQRGTHTTSPARQDAAAAGGRQQQRRRQRSRQPPSQAAARGPQQQKAQGGQQTEDEGEQQQQQPARKLPSFASSLVKNTMDRTQLRDPDGKFKPMTDPTVKAWRDAAVRQVVVPALEGTPYAADIGLDDLITRATG
jgi:hypothetical protein